MRSVLANGTIVIVAADGTTMIVHPDGRQVYGEPQRNADQAATAIVIGYGDDAAAMVADHDPLHALLTDWLGLPASVALFGGPPEIADAEEGAVLAVQKLMRLAGGRLPLPAPRQHPDPSHRMRGGVCVCINCGLDDEDMAIFERCCPDESDDDLGPPSAYERGQTII